MPRQEIQDCINQPLKLDQSISSIWTQGHEFSPVSRLYGKRLLPAHNLLVRKLLNGDHDIDGATIDQSVETATDHFDRLRQYGMLIVNHLNEPVADAHRIPKDDYTSTIGYGASTYITNLKVVKNQPRDFHKRAVRKRIVDPLIQYLEWCQSNKPEMMLADIYVPDQYSYHKPSKQLILHDTDPATQVCTIRLIIDMYNVIEQSFSNYI